MAISNAERIGKVLDTLKNGLMPFVEREMKQKYGDQWTIKAAESFLTDSEWNKKRLEGDLDVQALLSIMWSNWELVFKRKLGQAERSLVAEIRQIRNNWAHQQPFSTDDAYRGIDSIHRLLLSISSPEAVSVDKQKQELLRVKYDDQVRHEQRKMASHGIDGQPKQGLRPWREIMTPHQDVASGRYQQAEFAVDLWQIHQGEGSPEYRDPAEFFRRTFITQGLDQLFTLALKRLSGIPCDPVVQLQTNFGGGKTHSMLALYHLFSGEKISSLSGLDKVLSQTEVKVKTLKVNRAVLVGTYISPGQPSRKDDGTVVNTLWGELAYQLGGKAGYQMIADADKNSTNPGTALKSLFDKFSPCLVLIDEWVAYARQLYETSGLPAGTLDTHFTFAQSLSECAKTAKDTLLVVSIPASDAEIGGEGGRIALKGLTKAIGRVETPWRPATPDESFEIVRRRLFQEINDTGLFTGRDAVVKAFGQQYRDQKMEFPSECSEADYEKRIKAAYPIHPSLFDALYEDWSTLDKFQRTRGVLRLMSSVIHRLWLQEDKSLMIMPAHVPLEDLTVQPELTRYLDDDAQWPPIISKDIDGPDSAPFALDKANPTLGRYSASRRVSRTIFLHTAPHSSGQERGISEKQIRVGCIQPGEVVGTFSDALRRLMSNLTHLYESDGQFYYSLKPNVTRIARDRAEHIEDHIVSEKLMEKVKAQTGKNHGFVKVYVLPQNPSEVPDDQSARLVILGPDAAHSSRNQDGQMVTAVQNYLNNRGSGARKYRNTLAFLVPDASKIKELEQAIKILKAWESVQEDSEKGILDLSASQKKTMEAKLKESNGTVDSRIKETFIWLVVPTNSDSGEITFEESRVQQTSDGLAERISKKMEEDRSLLKAIAPIILKNELDNHLWKDADYISVRRLWDCFCSYPYLMRLRDEKVLIECIQKGVNQPVWAEFFAYADGYDEKAKRFVNLQVGKPIDVDINGPALLVKPLAARRQIDLESGGDGNVVKPLSLNDWKREQGTGSGAGQTSIIRKSGNPSRFFGSASVSPDRLGSEARKLAEEVVAHLAALVDSNVEITIEIKAVVPKGVPETTVRTVTENCKALKVSGGFEDD